MKNWLYISLVIMILICNCSEIDALKQGRSTLETVYQSTDIISHPGSVQTKNGDLVIVFTSQEKDQTLPGQILAIRKSEIKRGWSKPDTLVYSPWSCEFPAITRLRDGLLYLVMTQTMNGTNKGCYAIVSYDDGIHFSAPRKINMEGVTQVRTHAPVIELYDGSLIWPLEGVDSTKVKVAFLLKSTDRGETWDTPSIIAHSDANNLQLNPQILELTVGNLLCILNSGNNGYVRQSYSTDGGNSWSPHQAISIFGSQPGVILSKRGTLITTFYDQWPKGFSTNYSYDMGRTWENEKQILEGPFNTNQLFCCRLLDDDVIEINFVDSKLEQYTLKQLHFPVEMAKSVKGLSAKMHKNNTIRLRWNAEPNAKYYILYKKQGTVLSSSEFSIDHRYQVIAQTHYQDSDIERTTTYSYAVSSVIGQGPANPGTGIESELSNPIVIPRMIEEKVE